MTSKPAVSIILLAFRDLEGLARAIDSVERSVPDTIPYEVIVYANGVAREHIEHLCSHPQVRILTSAVNRGFAGGCNAAVSEARGEYILLLNDDVVVAEGWLEPLLELAHRRPDAGAIGSRILAADGTLREAGAVVWKDGATHGVATPPDDTQYMAVRAVDYSSAASLLVRKSTWEKIGGICEDYFPAYYEDVDLAFSIWAAGEKVLYQPKSVVFHDESVSTERDYRIFLLYRNREKFAEKWKERLACHEERVQSNLDASVHRSVLRAQGYPRQVLVCGTLSELEDASHQIGALGQAGYGVAIAICDRSSDRSQTLGHPSLGGPAGSAALLISQLGQMGVETVALGREGLTTHLERPEILYSAALLLPSLQQEQAAIRAAQPMATILPIEPPKDLPGMAETQAEAVSQSNNLATMSPKTVQKGRLVAMLDIAMATTRERYA